MFDDAAFEGHLTVEQIKNKLHNVSSRVELDSELVTKSADLPKGDKYVDRDDVPIIYAAHGTCTEELKRVHELKDFKVGDKFTYCAWTEHDEEYDEDDEDNDEEDDDD